MPWSDWQFWIVTLLALLAVGFMARKHGWLHLGRKKKSGGDCCCSSGGGASKPTKVRLTVHGRK